MSLEPTTADEMRARYAEARARLNPVQARSYAIRAEFVDRQMTVFRRSTEDLAKIIGCAESVIWNMRASMDAVRRK